MIFLIVFSGLVLRLISLNQSLWLDEATTASVAKMSLSGIFSNFLPADFHPPLYYLFMKYWTAVFGYSEVSLRVPSVLFGLGTVYVVFLIGRKLLGEKTAILTSILIATSGLSIYYSQEARMYALAAFLVSCSIYFFLESKWVAFSVILALIGMTDYVSLFVIPVFMIIGWKYRKKVILSFIPLAAISILWSPYFFKQILGGLSVKGSNWWNILGLPTFKNFVFIPVKFIFGRISFDNKNIYLAVTATALFFFGFLLFKSLKAPKILWTWLIIPIFTGLASSFVIPTLTYFRYLFCLMPFYLLVAYGAGKIGKFRKSVIAILVIFNIFTAGYYLFDSKFQREDWRSTVNFIESKKSGNSITVFPANSNMEAYLYYAPNAKITGREGIERGYSQIWLMTYLSSVFDPGGTAKLKIKSLGYKEASLYQFKGIGSVYLYEK